MVLAETYELLFRHMEENWLHARQAEEKRAMIATVNLLIASVMNGIVVFTGLSHKTLPLALWMIVLGIYGIATSVKLYERSQFHISRARKLRARLDELCPDAQVEHLQRIAEDEHKLRHPVVMNVRLNNIWVGLHILIAASGILYTIIGLIGSERYLR